MAASTIARSVPRAIRRTRWEGIQQTRRNVATAAAAVDYNEPAPYTPEPPSIAPSALPRRDAVRTAAPFSDFLTDTFARQHDYLRISITERCNLRCLYCMPEEGIDLSPPKTQLTTAEIYYLSQLFVHQGVNKIRLTGGEPTIRKDILPLMQRIGSLRSAGLKELALTTNGISLWRKLDVMVEAGLTGVNISLDTLDPFQFQLLTRRQGFDAVMKSISRVQELNKLGAGVKLKINCVVMRGLNDHQVLPFVDLTQDQDIEVRFIEYMPFGGNKWSENKMLPYAEMLDVIRTKYPGIARMKGAKTDTSKTWQVPGHAGRVGFITSMTHNFCGTCNRLRITSDGNLKVCLHGETEVSLRDLLRKDGGGEPMNDETFDAIRQLELDRRKAPGLRFDGEEGWMSKEQQLLEVIGIAVKRKKAKHAGIGQLENMKNRPMILIGGSANDDDKDRSNERPSLASSFGFQSLSGLFKEPTRGRYSRPRPRPTEDQQKTVDLETEKTASDVPRTRVDTDFFDAAETAQAPRPAERNPPATAYTPAPHSTPPTSDLPHVTDSETPSAINPAHQAQQTRRARLVQKHFSTREIGEEGVDYSRIAASELRKANAQRWHQGGKERSVNPTAVSTAFRGGVPRGRQRPIPKPASNPFARNPDTERPNDAAAGGRGVRGPGWDGQGAWGISEDDLKIVDSFTSPDTTKPSRQQGNDSTKDEEPRPIVRQVRGSSPEPRIRKSPTLANPTMTDLPPDVPDVHSKEQRQEAKKLTHVTSTGEAHMVDVGAKAATRRAAVAFATVRFGNPEPFQLIFENSNKKGDVLGVARIAGIMAAKRTSDLIPLCHPIPISKVEVDVKLEPPVAHQASVTIQALVETIGPTGVEMEALTAVSAASLTVYDMCKAVDKNMNIENARLVYKSGGRSGLFVRKIWAEKMGRGWLEERALEWPATWGTVAGRGEGAWKGEGV